MGHLPHRQRQQGNGLLVRCIVHGRCATVSGGKALRFERAFTRERSSGEVTTLPELGSTWMHASQDWQVRERYSYRAPCMIWSRVRISDLTTAAPRH